jgi:hypothetical protein
MNTPVGTDEYLLDIRSHPIKGIDDRMLNVRWCGQCILCLHFKDNVPSSPNYHQCAAFDDIPLEIWNREVDHSKPYPNDKGFRFTPSLE